MTTDLPPTRSFAPPAPGYLRLINADGVLKSIDSNGAVRRVGISAGTPVLAAYAAGTLTGTTIAGDDTVTIGDVTYTFVAALTGGDGDPYEVLVGASDSDSLDNLIAAINGAAGEGSTYGTGTVAHPLVTAVAGDGDTMDVTSIGIGPGGNTIATTASLTAGDWAAATLEGGAHATPATAGDELFDASFRYLAVADVGATSTTGWKKVALSAL